MANKVHDLVRGDSLIQQIRERSAGRLPQIKESIKLLLPQLRGSAIYTMGIWLRRSRLRPDDT